MTPESAIIVAVVGGAVAIIGTVINLIIAVNTRKGTEKAQREDMDPPSWVETWKRLDAMEAKLNAAVRILISQNDQWPTDAPAPTLNPRDVKILEDTLPARFRSLPRSRPAR